MGLKISAAVYSHIGHRPNNEDNFFVNGLFMEREQMNKGGRYHAVYTDDAQIFAVCDGMGGAELGEEASLRAVKMLKEFHQNCAQPDSTVYLNDLVADMSERVDAISLERGRPSGDSGCTIAMLVMKDWYFRTVNVGDSRVYQLHDGELTRVTKDDSEVQQMLDRGEITAEEAWQHPLKNVITRHLGMPMNGERLKPTVSERMDLTPGDRYLICSDGLSDEVPDDVIRDLLRSNTSPADAAAVLVRRALSESEYMGIPSDNVTVIVIDVLKAGERNDNQRRVRRMNILRAGLAALSAAAVGGLIWRCIELFRFLKK